MKSHSTTLHFLSANTVLHNSLRTDSTAIVPEGPWSSAASQTLSHPMLLATSDNYRRSGMEVECN